MPECRGYGGKVLKIDLCGRRAYEYPWDDQARRTYLGGKIMAARLLLDHLTGSETAFSEDNCVIITTGPLTGSGAPGSARFDIAALSPKDDLPSFSNCGGDFGVRLKKAGYDALILTGRSQEPCWLEITQTQTVFHSAHALWGSGTGQCQQELALLLGKASFGRLCIGPAGENLVKFASVISEDHSTGRAGIGAVLGWKNVKAITVTGSNPIPLYDPAAVADWNRKWYTQLRKASQTPRRGEAVCLGCPLHCAKHFPQDAPILNELGLDAIAAGDAAAWAAERGTVSHNLYEDIALRRGMGAELADGVPRRKGKGGKRRKVSYDVIKKAFSLPSGETVTDDFCRHLTQAVSASGQCMFTVGGLCGQAEGEAALPVLKMLALVSGMQTDPDAFLQWGARWEELEQQLRRLFIKPMDTAETAYATKNDR